MKKSILHLLPVAALLVAGCASTHDHGPYLPQQSKTPPYESTEPVVLLDIGLPDLNGLDAARQISKLAPNARIIFLTQESASDVVGEALSLGAWGYVAKVQAGRELLVAVEMVMQGQRFVSSGLNGHK